MKLFLILFILLQFTISVIAQDDCILKQKQRQLYNEIKLFDQVESKYLGCYGTKSFIFKKVDSLRLSMPYEEFAMYFNDSSYSLKFYSFMAILANDDSLAFQLLKKFINDTTKIKYHFTVGFNYGIIPFNNLIAGEYSSLIKSKYLEGSFYDSFYHSYYDGIKKNKRTWVLKRNELCNLLANSNMALLLEEDNCQE